MSRQKRLNTTLRCTARAVQLLLAWPLCATPGWVGAALTDLANAPLGQGTSSITVKPNVAMVIDDSGSMAWANMPGSGGTNDDKLCYGNRSYNTLAYDPTYTYKPPYRPVDATTPANGGTVPTGNPYHDNKPRYPDATFGTNGAWSNGYASSGGKNLTTNKPLSYWGEVTTTEKECSWQKQKGQNVWVCADVEKNTWQSIGYYYSTTTSPSATCQSDSSYTPITDASQIQGRGETGTDNAKTNYANWYSYYRTRAGMMKASTGEAFSSINNNYRVGLFFLTTNNNTPIKIDDFSESQRQAWYNKLYGATVDNGTPLRRALSNMGRMYAGLEKPTFGDPVQYSCQQNFTILSTDGYWNGDGPQNLSTPPSGVGDVDSNADRPYFDKNAQADTLADTAFYYYNTDLRTSALGNCSNTIGTTTYDGLCTNNVPGAGADVNEQQHMTTFTLGLGVSGTVQYEPNYTTAADITGTLQYYDILNKTNNWAKITDWDCNNNCPPQIDDLWHAAVNGRGTYYSASNPSSVETGLRDALAGVSARIGTASAAATSNLEPVAGDNAVYMATYRSVKWDGDLSAYTINPSTGALSSPDTPTWSAQKALDLQVSGASSGDGRTIKYFSTASTATNNLQSFTYANLNADSKGSNFANVCSNSLLSQCLQLTDAQKTLANTGNNLVNYLRGQSTYEAKLGATNPLYRAREHVLGDAVNAMPVYVKKPQFDYGKYDTTYTTFKDNNASRAGNVYMAANDGMLHAINADNGQERWAFVPSFVMPAMHKLADTNYTHQYYVDGSPTVADVCATLKSGTPSACASSTDWKTILVAGLNKGGCGYYALDVSDPANPKGLWEFSNDNLGYSYGNPVVTRRKDGKWVAIFTSGYNNVPGTCGKTTGDGVGRVFVVDAMTGELLDTISTGEGSTTTPSNLGKLNAWVDNAQLNTADVLYAGDMLGNIWRIDFDDNHALPSSGKDAFKLATLQDASGVAQPITVKPELAYVQNSRVVMVGTGRLLNTSDLGNHQTQSLYGLKDDLTATSGIGNPRASSNAAVIKARSFTTTTNSAGKSIRTISGDAINWSSDKGWYVDFSTAGERINVDMQLQYNILTAATNVPEDNACTSGGYGWLYYFDIETGKHVTTAADSAVGYRLSANALVAGIKTIKLQNGKTVTIVSNSEGGMTVEAAPSPTGAAAGAARRTMWREIQD